MIAKFDTKSHARSLSRLLEMADVSITKPGGAIHTERLVDYVTGEFGRLTADQCLAVLAEVDKDYQKNLLKDGYGGTIGYAYSKKIFVSLRRDQSNDDSQFAKVSRAREVSSGKSKQINGQSKEATNGMSKEVTSGKSKESTNGKSKSKAKKITAGSAIAKSPRKTTKTAKATKTTRKTKAT